MRSKRLLIGSLATFGVLMGLCMIVRPADAQRRLAFEHDRDMYVPIFRDMPHWSGKLLLRHDGPSKAPLIDTVDRDGYHEQIPFEVPNNNSRLMISSIAAGSDGSLVVGALAEVDVGDRVKAVVVWISPDRQRRTLIRTSPFGAQAVALAADGTIWAAGHSGSDVDPGGVVRNVLQRYDLTGKLLSALKVPTPKYRAGLDNDAGSASDLLASRDRVGWFTNGCQYIEFSLDGVELNRFDGPPGMDVTKGFDGVALSDDNDLVVGRRVGNGTDVLALDRTTRSWVSVSLPNHKAGTWLAVFGFDGTTLVTSPAHGTLRRFKPTEDAPGRE